MQLENFLDIIDQPTAWAWIRRRYLPAGAICPRCGQPITGPRALAAFEAQAEKTYCAGCSRDFRTRAITPLAGTEWEAAEFVQCLLLASVGRSNTAIAAQLGKSPRCVRDLLDRIQLLEASAVQPGMYSLAEGLTAQG